MSFNNTFLSKVNVLYVTFTATAGVRSSAHERNRKKDDMVCFISSLKSVLWIFEVLKLMRSESSCCMELKGYVKNHP